jgi:diguanylate cyclase (GGDEF)-like protein
MGTQHVVIVDDNDLSLKLLSGLALEVPSAVPHPFQSSQDALAWCTGQSVDCFILDYHMPAPDGLEMVRLLREVPAFALVPIVIVTGEGERDVRYKALAAGANDFIQKPVDRREFVARITTHLSLQAARGQLAMHVDQLEASLRDEGQRASDHAHRLEALWRMSNNTALDDEELLQAMLEQGAAALRPGMSFCGMLSRLDGSEIVVEAAFYPLDVDVPEGLHAADRTPLEDSASIEVIRGGISRYWDDVLTEPAFVRRKRVRQLHWRSLISTPFRAGGASYFLTFAAQQPTAKAFGKEDLAYIELLGAFFGTHLQQRWQWSRIRYQSEHDALTGLRNRGQFRSEGRLALAASFGGAVAIANVDDFRQVNETFGTVIGDALLVEVGAALAKRANEGEIVARLDGDAFGIFLPEASRASVERRVAEFAAAFDAGFSTGDREGKESVGLTATVGVALAPDDARTFDELLARADAAISAAKESRRGRTTFFAAGMEGRSERRLRLVNEIVEALAREEFELYFQPHIDLTTMSVSGAEALIRWNHPTRGLLLPDEFIPFAERHGLIKSIGSWVMQQAIASIDRLCASDSTFRLFFNLSAVQLEDTALIDGFVEAASSGVRLENLGVELTETSAMRDAQTTLRFMSVLREHGVHVAIDDFGVGFSSLALLKSFPLDVVKIDRSFVNAVIEDQRDSAIAEAVISFGATFGYVTVAEGVERVEQIDWLRARGCRFAQGYAICRPLPMDAYLEWYARNARQVRIGD